MTSTPGKRSQIKGLAPLPLAACALLSGQAALAEPLIFACSADNDLFRVASENGMDLKRFDTPRAAVEAAGDGSAVLLLADGYPAATTVLDAFGPGLAA